MFEHEAEIREIKSSVHRLEAAVAIVLRLQGQSLRRQGTIMAALNIIHQEELHVDASVQALIDQATASEAGEANATKTITDMLAVIQGSISTGMSAADIAAVKAKVAEMQATAGTLGAAVTSAAGVIPPAPAPVVPPAADPSAPAA